MANTLHPAVTRHRGLSYLFTDKHHGGGTSEDACWAVTRDEEFSVFDLADQMDILDEDGRLYGLLPDGKGGLRELGTWQQQVAEFPAARLQARMRLGMDIQSFGRQTNWLLRTEQVSSVDQARRFSR